jgi:sodium/potassium-transporting ATPase subunit alpha
MVSFCYGQIGLIEAAGGFFSYLVCLTECGFFPSRVLGASNHKKYKYRTSWFNLIFIWNYFKGTFWDSPSINDFKDSYGQEWTYDQRKRLEHAAQTCFFVGIVACQMANTLINKTKKVSVFQHGFRNMHMNAAILATIGLACLLIYVPKLNDGLGLYPIKGLWWLPAIPFSIYLFTYAELKKLICKYYPKTWYDNEMNW